MSTLENKIREALVEAVKLKQENIKSALRSIITAIQNEKTNGVFHELNDMDIIKIIQKLSKQRQESIDIYTQAGRIELAEAETKEKEILDSYLPQMLTDDKLKEVIDTIISNLGASTMKDMGRVMKELSSKYPNLYDGKVASNYIKTKLSNV